MPRSWPQDGLRIHPAPWLIAHRGARDEAPENTRAAFERALAYPVDGIELDVQMSVDGHLVFYHDWSLWRIARRRRRIHTMRHDELARLDWGAWFDSIFAGEPLPRAEAILSELGPRTRWLLEIKVHPEEKKAGRSLVLADRLLALIDALGERLGPERAHILSFDAEVLAYAAGKAPGLRYVLNLPERRPEDIMTAPGSRIAHLWAVDAAIGKVSRPLVDWAHRNGLRVLTYTCNTARQVEKALDLGVDAILTDRPGWLSQYLGRDHFRILH